MSRPLRHVRPGGSQFEITTRALQSRYLIPTGEHFRSIAVGIMARAKELYPVELYAFGGLSNHMHLLIGAADVDKLAGFMGFVNGNLAREANRIVDWKEKFWGRRYRAIEISDEEAAQVDRLRYVISHGPKENLVLRCRDWPGLQCVDARIREIVDDIDAKTARRVVLNGGAPLGAAAIRKQHPHDRPKHTKKSPAPAVHAATKAVRRQMKEAYRLFEEAYREAAASPRAGNLSAKFPPGCFPPPQPFIPADAGLPCSRAGPARAPG